MSELENKSDKTENSQSQPAFSAAKTAADHEAIQAMLGLNKPIEERGKFEHDKKKTGIRPFVVCLITLIVIGLCISAWVAFQYILAAQEQARFTAKYEREQAEEEARRNRIEYADIAFLESFPPTVAIAMDGKQMYARSKDGSYTELRARESSWIRNLPIKEDTILKFSFQAEGFKPLSRTVAYYDWYPSNKPSGNPLQKVYKKIVLEPDITPRIAECSALPKILEADPCEWSIFREIVFRERYADAVKLLTADESKQRPLLKSLLTLHPLLLAAAPGFDIKSLDTNQPIIAPELPDATKSLLKTLTEHPYGLYGSITIETDSPDTNIFFMSEPLMVVKASGSMSQVKVQPGEPYTFAVYGQGRPIDITQTLSIRLETKDAPAYVAEIAPHQWHCEVPSLEQIQQIPAPEIPAELASPDYRHYVCDYSLKLSVKFNEIKEIEKDASKQREIKDAAENAVKPQPANPNS